MSSYIIQVNSTFSTDFLKRNIMIHIIAIKILNLKITDKRKYTSRTQSVFIQFIYFTWYDETSLIKGRNRPLIM